MSLRAAVPLALAAILAVPVLLLGHAVVVPRTSAPGAYERYVLRVPNERTTATTRVEIRFPADLRVTAFEDVPGWQLEILTDSAHHVTGAVWTGTLPPQRFVEFPFMASNPKAGTRLVWPAFQTYASGEKVEWTGAAGSRTPASSTALVAAPGESAPASSWVAWVALVVALIGLGIALRPSRALSRRHTTEERAAVPRAD